MLSMLVFFTFLHQILTPRDRPAAFPVNVTSIDDTKNFDEFPEVELNFSKFSNSSILWGKLKKKWGKLWTAIISSEKPSKGGDEVGYKDWMFMNYTFKR